ncbi:MAG: OmpA family protein [Pseudomonadota bacterium]
MNAPTEQPLSVDDASPAMPRRVFLAAGLAALTAGGAVALATLGGLGAPQQESFRFSRGTAFAAGEEDRLRAFVLEAARDDAIAVVIAGHSGTSGDAEANRDLSQDRAARAAEIARAAGVPDARISVVALGGAAPLSQETGEAERAYQARLARVEVSLQVRR